MAARGQTGDVSPAPESGFAEIKRQMGFGPEDEAALHAFAPRAMPHLARIADKFYEGLSEHDELRGKLNGHGQAQLRDAVRQWTQGMFEGPWDDAYYERRARIGRGHEPIRVPQRFLFGAMDLTRMEFFELVHTALEDPEERLRTARALHKILDIELAILLEGYGAAVLDTARTQMEREAAHDAALHDDIVERAPVLITACDPTGNIVVFNAEAERVTGLPRLEAIGRQWLDVFVRDDDRDAVRASHWELLSGLPALAYEGQIADGDVRVQWRFAALADPDAPLCAIGCDVTSQHRLAIRSRRSQRIGALGAVAAGLGHEIRNPLNAAHLQLSVARKCVSRGDDFHELEAALDLVNIEIKRLAGLVNDFLQFARPQPLALATADLRGLVEEIVEQVAPEAEALGVDLGLVPGGPLRLELDELKMQPVLLALVRNAVEAVGRGGTVKVSARVRDGAVGLWVEDDGPAFPVDSPLYEPFSAHRDRGVGLGLAMVHRVVTDHGGTVDVESLLGRNLVSITLPVS